MNIYFLVFFLVDYDSKPKVKIINKYFYILYIYIYFFFFFFFKTILSCICFNEVFPVCHDVNLVLLMSYW